MLRMMIISCIIHYILAKRLEFIEKELKKVDDLCTAKQKEQVEIGNEIAQAQQKMQSEGT
jgi:DNA-binding protein H-NS